MDEPLTWWQYLIAFLLALPTALGAVLLSRMVRDTVLLIYRQTEQEQE